MTNLTRLNGYFEQVGIETLAVRPDFSLVVARKAAVCLMVRGQAREQLFGGATVVTSPWAWRGALDPLRPVGEEREDHRPQACANQDRWHGVRWTHFLFDNKQTLRYH